MNKSAIESMVEMCLEAKETARKHPETLVNLRGVETKALTFFRIVFRKQLEKDGVDRDEARSVAMAYDNWNEIYHVIEDSGENFGSGFTVEEVDSDSLDRAWAEVDEEDRRAERGMNR